MKKAPEIAETHSILYISSKSTLNNYMIAVTQGKNLTHKGFRLKFLTIKIVFVFTVIISFCQDAQSWETFIQESTTDSTVQGSHNTTTALQIQQTESRSRESITNVVNAHAYALKKLYDKHLKQSKIKGEIKIKLVINEFGKVISSQIMESSIKDSTFEAEILTEINSWVFNKVDKGGDSTEVVYPFVFKPDHTKIVAALITYLLFTISTSIMISQKISKR